MKKSIHTTCAFNSHKTFTITYNRKTKNFKIVQRVKGQVTCTLESKDIYRVSEISYCDQEQLKELTITGSNPKDIRELIKASKEYGKSLQNFRDNQEDILEYITSLEEAQQKLKNSRKYSDSWYSMKNEVIPHYKIEDKVFKLINKVTPTMNIKQFDRLLNEGWLCIDYFEVELSEIENRY